MPGKHKAPSEADIMLQVDDQTLSQLQELEGQQIEHAILWEDSVVAALADGDFGVNAVDIDVYLSDGVLFELYGVLLYTDVDSDPLDDAAEIGRLVDRLLSEGAWLLEVAVDTEDDLVLVLVDSEDNEVYLNAGAWTLDEWEELPE